MYDTMDDSIKMCKQIINEIAQEFVSIYIYIYVLFVIVTVLLYLL